MKLLLKSLEYIIYHVIGIFLGIIFYSVYGLFLFVNWIFKKSKKAIYEDVYSISKKYKDFYYNDN